MPDEQDPKSLDSAKTPFDWRGFSQKTWVIVLSGLIIPPVGMILTWLKPGWSTRTRLVATALMGVLLLWRSASQDSPGPNKAEDLTNTSSAQADAGSASAGFSGTETQSPEADPSAIKPLPDLKSRVRRGFFESEEAYRDRIFNQTVIGILEHKYGLVCEPGKWVAVDSSASARRDREFTSVVQRADGKQIHISLHEKDYQFVWGAFETSDRANGVIGYWKRDGTPISFTDYKDAFNNANKPEQPAPASSAVASQADNKPSSTTQGRRLPKVQRATWGPTTLSESKRYMLVDEPEKCKGKEYKMEVKYKGGGTRSSEGKLEDFECSVWTGSGFFQMEFSFPSDLKQPAIQPGDRLVLSFVFSGATRSFFSEPNVVTAVERAR